MNLHFDFSTGQILWTLTFAAELVLLVVLMGRDRTRRFPWFTANIVVMAFLLLVSRLLFGRMAPVTTTTISLAISDISAIIGLLVVFEVARRAFAGASRAAWIVATVVALVVGGAVVAVWGPWPARNTLTGASLLVLLRWMQMIADKGAVFDSLLGIEIGTLIVLCGRRFHGGWRSHPQQIAIGLSTAGLAELAIRLFWQLIATKITIRSHAEYQHALALRDRIYYASNLVFFFVIVWWIAWLWLDEPGTAAQKATRQEPPVEEPPRTL